MVNDPADPPRRPGTPSEDDLPPTGAEAGSQRNQTVKPLIWLFGAAILVLIFIAALVLLHGAAPVPQTN